MGAGAVRQGGVYIEIGADPRKLFATLARVNAKIAGMGRKLANAGGSIAAMGLGAAVPFAAAVASGTRFEDVLRNVAASTGATAAQLNAVEKASMQMSEALGIGPTEAAAGMLELLKAGMSLENVLGGAGEAAIQFAKAGQLDVATAAVVMSDAMNVFGVSAMTAANSISSAADASSTSITLLAESFQMSTAVAALANQSIGDLSASLAILANNGVKGSDAGTSIKTMLMRLMAPADEAIGALEGIGLSAKSFRDAAGNMLPMVDIIRVLNDAMGDMDKQARDNVFRKIFGSDAIRAAAILTQTGVDGFAAMRERMDEALPVGEKFKILMGGLSGAVVSVMGALERLAIAITKAVGKSLDDVVPLIRGFVDGLTQLVSKNSDAVANSAKLVAAVVGVGGAMVAVGSSVRVLSFGLGGLLNAAAIVVSPLMLAARTSIFVGASFKSVFGQIAGSSIKGIAAVALFATRSGLSLARASAGFGTLAVDAAIASAKLAGSMTGTALASVVTFTRGAIAAIANYVARSTALMTVSAGQAGAMGVAQVAATVSVISATVARAAEGNMRAAAIGIQALARLGAAGVANAMIASAAVARGSASCALSLSRIGTTAIAAGSAASISLVRVGTAASAAGSVTIGSLVRAAAVGIAQAAALSAAWIGGMARVAAAAALSGAAAAVSFVAPFLAIGAAIVAAGALVYSLKDQIVSALAPVGELAAQAGAGISSAFSGALAEATVVFSDMWATAKTTFAGISDAVTNGDIWGALEILWAGIQAIWLRGQESVMNAIDPWIVFLQNTFAYLGTGIATTWEQLWSDVASILNTAGAVLFGVFDNIINGIMKAWDTLEAGVRKAWIRVQGFFGDAKDTKSQLDAVDSEMSARATQRELQRPGIKSRVAKAGEQNAEREKQTSRSIGAANAATDKAAADRIAALEGRKQSRRDSAQAAEDRVASLSQKQSDTKDARARADELIGMVGQAETMDELRQISQEIHDLQASGMLTESQTERYNSASDAAAERITENESGKVEDAAKQGGKDAAESKSDIVGTFSAFAASGLGGGSNLAERTAKAAEATAKYTQQIAEQSESTVGV